MKPTYLVNSLAENEPHFWQHSLLLPSMVAQKHRRNGWGKSVTRVFLEACLLPWESVWERRNLASNCSSVCAF